MNRPTTDALKRSTKALMEACGAVHDLAKEACLTEDPHSVWVLINQLHSLERMERQIRRRYEHIPL